MSNKYKIEFRGYSPSLPSRRNLDLKYSKSCDRDKIIKALDMDFFHKCGYCGWGSTAYSQESFQIDHFNPTIKNKEQDSYQNYVYACPICNKTKKRYVCEFDPISKEYSSLFIRNDYGLIQTNKNINPAIQKKADVILVKIGLCKDIHAFDYFMMLLNRIDENIRRSGRSKELADDKDLCESIASILSKLIKRATYYKRF